MAKKVGDSTGHSIVLEMVMDDCLNANPFRKSVVLLASMKCYGTTFFR